MEKSRDYLTGFIFFGLLALLVIFTIFLADFRFGSRPGITVAFRDVAGLEAGDEVRINGLRSGRVSSILPVPEEDRIRVGIEFYEEPVLFANASVSVASSSALGGKHLALDRGTSAAGRLDSGAVIQGTAGGGDVMATAESAMARAEEILAENQERIGTTLANLEEFSGTLNTSGARNLELLEETLSSAQRVLGQVEREDLAGRMGSVLDRLDGIARQVEEGEGLLGTLVADGGLAADVKAAAGSLKAVLAGVERGEGSLGKLLTDDGLYERATGAVASLESFAAGLGTDRGLGKFMASEEPWARLERTFASAERAVGSVERAAAQLNDPSTPVGFLLYDQDTVTKLKRGIAALNSFLETQRENAPLTTFAGLLLSPF